MDQKMQQIEEIKKLKSELAFPLCYRAVVPNSTGGPKINLRADEMIKRTGNLNDNFQTFPRPRKLIKLNKR